MAAYILLIIVLFAGASFLFASAYVHSAIPHAILGVAMIALDLYLLSRLADDEVDGDEDEEEPVRQKRPIKEQKKAEELPGHLPDRQEKEPEPDQEDDERPKKRPVPEKEEEPEEPRQRRTWRKEEPEETEKKPSVPKKPKKEKPPKGFKKVKVFPKGNDKEAVSMFLKFYKVRQNHITVLIDNSKKYDIKQCPAYLWPESRKGLLHILLLEEPVREITLHLSSVNVMVYKRAVPAEPRKEYLELREPSLKSAIFSSYIPEYYDAGTGAFASAKQVKNLYQIAPDIQFPEKCAKEVMDLLNLDFVVYDKYTKSDQFSEYFKAGHRYQILLRDKVLEPEEYKDRIQNLMRRMIVANIDEDTFDDTIRQMVMHSMIGSDNGEFYRAQRVKYLAEKGASGQKSKKKKRK